VEKVRTTQNNAVT